MNNVKILPKILIPILITLLVALFALTFFPLVSFIDNNNDAMENHLKAISLGVEKDFEKRVVNIGFQARALAYDGEMVRLVMQKDYTAIGEYIDTFIATDKADFFIITDEKGVILYNTIDASNNGKDLGDLPAVQAGLIDEGYTEMGDFLNSPFAMYHGAGLYLDGMGDNPIIASVICGYHLEDPKYVDSYKNDYGVETTLFKDDIRISTTLTDENNQRMTGTALNNSAIYEKVVKNGENYITELQLGARPFVGYYSPLINGNDETVGIFFCGLSAESSKATARGSLILSCSIAAIALLLVIIILYLIVNTLVKRMDRLARTADYIAGGNLNIKVERDGLDELGDLANSFNEMRHNIHEQVKCVQLLEHGDLTVEIPLNSEEDDMGLALSHMVQNLNGMFSQIQHASGEVAAVTRQISTGSQNLAAASSEQASSVEELSAAVTTLSDKTKTNAEMAEQAAELANTIKGNAEKGSTQMQQMMQAVKEINDASQSINKVIKVIDDIAFQTNILALNAAVEAARAGQHGKGFAVVADEVRSLAAKSAEAAKDTGGLITNSMDKAQLGARIAEETSSSLSEIVDGINQSTTIVGEIATSSKEQSDSIRGILHGIDQVSEVVNQNSATSEESAAAAVEMSKQTEVLNELVSRFKLNDDAPKSDPVSLGGNKQSGMSLE